VECVCTYHYNRYRLATTNQFDITAGKTPQLVSNTPVEPRFVTFMLQGTIGSHFTSQTHGSYMRDWWAWGRQALAPQLPGTNGALKPVRRARLAGTGGASKVWGDPVNFDTQNARSRLWGGQRLLRRARRYLAARIAHHQIWWQLLLVESDPPADRHRNGRTDYRTDLLCR